jgi:lactam utilization protein B
MPIYNQINIKMREEANLGQLYDMKLQYEETVDMLKHAVDKQQKIVDEFTYKDELSLEENEVLLAFEKQQLSIIKSAYADKKYNDLEWITTGHDPLDHAIHSLKVGENEFADRYCKKDRRVSKRRTNLQTNW